MARKRSFWDKFWRDERGRDVIWMRPNKLLITWFVTACINLVLRGGVVQDILSWIGVVALFFWALLELVWGVNYFRKLLGFCVFVIVVFTKFL